MFTFMIIVVSRKLVQTLTPLTASFVHTHRHHEMKVRAMEEAARSKH